MKRVLVLIAVLGLWSLPLMAGEFLMNDSGETATALRVTFSEPVTITGFGDTLMEVSPSRESSVFTFSGGEVESWGTHWLNWEPASASLLEAEWLSSGWDLPADARAEDFDCEVTLEGIDTILTVSRHIDRNCLPFTVTYSVVNPQALDGYTIAWDADKYVDTDGSGDPQDDREFEGTILELLYFENYNPTVTMLVLDENEQICTQWENMPRNDFIVGTPVALDGERLLSSATAALDDTQVTWSQVHMEKMTLEYTTEYEAALQQRDSFMAEATHDVAGKYVYELSTAGSPGSQPLRVTAWVTQDVTRQIAVGLTMSDIWNEGYDPDCNCMLDKAGSFTDQQGQDKLKWLREQGMYDILIMNQLPVTSSYPVPEFFAAAPGMHHIGDADLEMLFSHIDVPHLAWQYAPSDEDLFGPDPDYYRRTEEHSEEHLAAFFFQYREFLVGQAKLAERSGVRSFTIGTGNVYVQRLCSMAKLAPFSADWIRDQLVSLLAELRDVFSGAIGVGMPIFAHERPERCAFVQPLVETADFLVEDFADYTRGGGPFHPADSVDSLRAAYADYLDVFVAPLYGVFEAPLRIQFWAKSVENGSTSGFIPGHEEGTYDTWQTEFLWTDCSEAILQGRTNPDYVPDFRDQVRAIEALMPVLAEAGYIEGVFPKYEFWKLLDFGGFAPAGILDYFNVFTGSLQGKPAFEAYRFWASMLSPNERLLYRRLTPIPGPPFVDDDLGLANLLSGSWEEAVTVAELPRDYIPETFTHSRKSYAIEESEHWLLPGHSIKTVRMLATQDVVAIRWDGWDADLNGAFRYNFSYFDESTGSALQVDADPLTQKIILYASADGEWRGMPADLTDHYISDECIVIYLPAQLRLPSGHAVSDVIDWAIGGVLVFPTSGGFEFYNLFSAPPYSRLR